MTLCRGLLALLLVLSGPALPAAAAGLALPASAAAPAPLQRVHRAYSFDGAGTGVLVLQGSVAWDSRGGLLAQVSGDGLRAGGRPADVYFPSVQDLGGDPLRTYGRLGDRDLCADPVTTCTLTPSGLLTFTSVLVVVGDETSEAHTRFHLFLEGTRLRVSETLVGFRARPGGAVRRVTATSADGAGARTPAGAAEALLAASAPGGRRGSIALASPPCPDVGAGTVLLTGPGVVRPSACPTSTLAAVAGNGGTWSLRGPAAGVSTGRTRLLVLDL